VNVNHNANNIHVQHIYANATASVGLAEEPVIDDTVDERGYELCTSPNVREELEASNLYSPIYTEVTKEKANVGDDKS
jgi:hypothetical protein